MIYLINAMLQKRAAAPVAPQKPNWFARNAGLLGTLAGAGIGLIGGPMGAYWGSQIGGMAGNALANHFNSGYQNDMQKYQAQKANYNNKMQSVQGVNTQTTNNFMGGAAGAQAQTNNNTMMPKMQQSPYNNQSPQQGFNPSGASMNTRPNPQPGAYRA